MPNYAPSTSISAVKPATAGRRSRRYREVVNAGGAPSEMVIEDNRAHSGHEFRDETEGEHPVVEQRTRPGPFDRGGTRWMSTMPVFAR